MAEEAGLSLSFQALGLEQIQAKIATTSRSFKSLERQGKQLSGLGSGLGRLASLGGGGKGGGGGAAGGLIREMASFAVMTRLATKGFRFFDSIGAERLITRRAVKAVAAKGRRVVRRAGRVAGRVAGAFPEVKMIAKEIATGYKKLFSSASLIRLIGRGPAAKVAGRVAGAFPEVKMIAKEIATGYKKLFSSASLIRLIGRGPANKLIGAISSVGKSVGGVARRVSRGVTAGVVLGSRAVRSVTLGVGVARRVARRVARAIPEVKIIGKKFLSGYRKLFSSASLIRLIGRGPAAKVTGAISSVGKSVGGVARRVGRGVGSGIGRGVAAGVVLGSRAVGVVTLGVGAARRVARRVGSGIGRGVAAGVVLGSRAFGVVTSGVGAAFAKLGAAVTGIVAVIGTTGAAIAISAGAILAVIGGAYFKIDKKIASAMKWLNQNVFKPIGENLSKVGEFWKNALGRLAERGDLLSKAYTDRQAKVRFTPQERQFYEQQVKFDLETDDMEEGIQTQIDELRAIWKEQDKKFSEGLNRIVEDMLHKDRI